MKEVDTQYLKWLKTNKSFELNMKTQTLKLKRDAKHYIFFSDIHGNRKTINLIDKAQFDFNDARLVGGGDYIDGWKYSKWVTDCMEEFVKMSGAIILKGNHEQMMLDYADGLDDEDSLWFANGGKTTLRSFFPHQNVSHKAGKILLHYSNYYDFYQSAPIMLETPHYIFLHAGVLPVEDYAISPKYKDYHFGNLFESLNDYDGYRMWARDEYFFYSNGGIKYFAHNKTGKTIVTGHTPTALVQGYFDDGSFLREAPFNHCVVKELKYPNEPARILTDNGCHSRYPTHNGNVTVLDDKGNIVAVYDYSHPDGIEWSDYVKENEYYMANKQD